VWGNGELMIKYLFAYVLTCLFTFINVGLFAQVNNTDCNCDYVVLPNVLYVDGDAAGIGPGDVVCVMASSKRYLGFTNFHGAPGNPIKIINCGGRVIIKDTDWYYGIKFVYSSHFILSGTGSGDQQYGFLVDGTPPQIAGLGIGGMSTDFEIDHIEISRTGFAGMTVKSDPDCSGLSNQGNFTQYNTSIHDNYVHNTGGEGIYVGFPHSRGLIRVCDGDSIRVYPHDIVGLRIFKNIIESTGKEGLQVGCAVSDVAIYENSINNFGLNNSRWQRSGVHLSTGTTGKFYSNSITNGTGSGIWLNALGDNLIYNNIIANVGKSGEDGIMIYDSLVADGKSYNIINNTIVNHGGNGMKVYTFRNTNINLINNIICGSGQEFISTPTTGTFISNNNITKDNPVDMLFENLAAGNYRLTENSPAVDAGMNMGSYSVVNDYEYIVRPRGQEYDAGAFESPYERMRVHFSVFPNPISTVATINFVLSKDSEASIKMYDVYGRVVAIIIHDYFKSMKLYEFQFDSFFLAQGIYYYTLETEDETKVIKVLLVE
jgi:hypothetical protein